MILSIFFILFIDQCLSQKGFPKQFQATFNITGANSGEIYGNGIRQLLYDYENLRARMDIQGFISKENETYMVKYKPEGAEADSPASQGYTLFNLHPDYPAQTKGDCWYRTDPMGDVGPLPMSWFYDSHGHSEMQPWFPLPSNLINKGAEWIPEIQQNATRYDSPEICDLKRSGRGPVPCLSYFETSDRPVKTITTHVAHTAYDADEYISTFYLSFTHGIPSEAEHLFNLPNQWPTHCGNANSGFVVEPIQGFVVTPQGNDNFKLKLQTPPIRSLGTEVKIDFKVQPNWYYNGTRCVQFNPIIFNQDNWEISQEVDMSFVDYGCCTYQIIANGGGYDWLYNSQTITVYSCDGEAGHGCNGKYPCGG